MNLPVSNVEESVKFYEKMMAFVSSLAAMIRPRLRCSRVDNVRIGLAKNGGDPTQDGCAFEVHDIENLFAEFKANGLAPREGYEIKSVGSISGVLDTEQHDDGSKWRVFFVVAPDGLCYWFGEKSV
jgi:hypothetical protein